MTVRQMLHHTALRSRHAALPGAPGEIHPAGTSSHHRRRSADVPGYVIDMRRAARDGRPGPAAPRGGLESVQSVDAAVVDPRDDMVQVQAVTALARALSRRSTGSAGGGGAGGGPGSVGGASPRSVGGGPRFGDAPGGRGGGAEGGAGI